MDSDVLTLQEWISLTFIVAGTLFMVIAAIGLLRFPDFYSRMSAITKGTTIGLGLVAAGMGIYFNRPDTSLKVLLIISFIMVTTPIAAHVIARTAVRNKAPFSDNTDLTEFTDYLHEKHLEQEKKQEKLLRKN